MALKQMFGILQFDAVVSKYRIQRPPEYLININDAIITPNFLRINTVRLMYEFTD